MEWGVCIEMPIALRGVCKMDYNEWGFCSQEPPTHWAAFQWPQSMAAHSPQQWLDFCSLLLGSAPLKGPVEDSELKTVVERNKLRHVER